MIASEIMTGRPTTVSARTSIRSTLRKLAELDVRHLPVTSDGAVVGMVSDRDLRDVVSRLLLEAGPDLDLLLERPVGDVMSADVIAVDPETDVDEIIDLMVEHRIGAVPVVTPDTADLVGIVSYVDVLRASKTGE
ncbi:MAG TPA: CBS domain-containing protein [Polyangiaceae bacterium]|nr:CBS domain-containing protein [Polyangiaceae bacterium]